MPSAKKVHVELMRSQDAQGRLTEPYQILQDLIAEHHTDAVEAKVALAWHHNMKEDKDGRVRRSVTKKVGDLERQLSPERYDFIIQLNSTWWRDPATRFEDRVAELDHACSKIRPVLDENDEAKVDENGSIVWRNRKPDIEEFLDVTRRRGAYHELLKEFSYTLGAPIIPEAGGVEVEETASDGGFPQFGGFPESEGAA